jgi:hypothetical protein
MNKFQSSIVTQSHTEVDVYNTGGIHLGQIPCDVNPRAMRHGGREGSARQEADACVLWCVWGSWEEM